MANVMKALKEEIARIARSEINKALNPIKSVNANQRKYIADLRRQITDLEKELKLTQKAADVKEVVSKESEAEAAQPTKGWISAKGILSMRKRLRLSQKAFAELAGVSLATVVKWEAQKDGGKLNIRRKAALARLQEIKTMGLRDVATFFEKKTG
jgi:DNA-binding transcriptional regulator YiaG